MKIAYVVYDYLKPGGIEKYVRKLARIYAREHDVHVITANLQAADPSITFHAVMVPSYLPSFARLVVFSRRAERELSKERYDIIHSQGADCRIHNVITAHSCHRAWVEKARASGLGEYLKKCINPLHAVVLRNERTNYARIIKGIAVSHEVKNEVLKYYKVPGELIEVIYPGVEIRKDDPETVMRRRKAMRTELGISDREFVILFVANEFRRKGLAQVIDALSILNDPKVKLLVIGKGNRIPYLMQAKNKGVRDRVMFAGPSGKVMDYYEAGDLFLLPTKHEAFGMVITEAMSTGLPVVVTRYAGAAELISDRNCLIDDPANVQEIAARIHYFVSNRKIAEETGAALRMVAEKYTWDAVAERTMAVYRAAAGQ